MKLYDIHYLVTSIKKATQEERQRSEVVRVGQTYTVPRIVKQGFGLMSLKVFGVTKTALDG